MRRPTGNSAGAVEAPPEADVVVRRYRVLAGCVECASDLTPLRRVAGVRDVRMLSATGVLAVEAPGSLDDTALLRAAASSGITLEPESATDRNDVPRNRSSWWLRPEMVCLMIAAALLVIAETFELAIGADRPAVILGALSIAVGILYPLRSAWQMVLNKRLSFNVLLIIAVAGAVPLGRIVEAACVVVIFSLGVVLESYVADKARKSIQKLMDLSPQKAERFTADGLLEPVPVEELEVDDVVLVRPGSRLPTDGEVVDGVSWVDASAITGESMPVEVGIGATVYGGTLNGDVALRVQVTKPFEDTVLSRVIREVEEAQKNKGSAERFADKFAGIYTPVMIALAVLMTVLGPTMFGLAFEDAFYRALVVLIVSCSCALVLSVPVSVVAAVARAARDGVLIKGGAYLEQLATVQAAAFDKTGTLTLGRPILVAVHPLEAASERELLSLAAGIEAGATHPIAEAVVHAARQRGLTVRPFPDVRSVAGIGATTTVDGRTVAVGRVTDLGDNEAAEAALAEIESAGATPVAVTDDGRLLGLLGVADELRPESRVAVEGLRQLGVVHTTMLTGDRRRVAEAIAAQTGIENVNSELMPEDKSAAIASTRDRFGAVAMVGDGINDAPALATADVAVVMGAAGTDVALETADIALMSDDLTKLPYSIALARRARRIVNQNIVLSLLAIVVMVVAALSGAFSLTQGVLLNEAYALVIISNGLRLLRGRSIKYVSMDANRGRGPRSVVSPAEPADTGCGCTTVANTAAE